MTEKETSQALIAAYYKDHVDELRAYVTKGTQNPIVGEDLVQDLFCRLLTTDRPLSQVTLPCLIYTMARHLVTDYWRHRSAVCQHEIYLRGCSVASRQVGEESVYAVREVEQVLERGIARLSEKQKAVYRMNLIDGLKVSEISRQLDENYKSVENRLGMARKEVRTYMRRMLA